MIDDREAEGEHMDRLECFERFEHIYEKRGLVGRYLGERRTRV